MFIQGFSLHHLFILIDKHEKFLFLKMNNDKLMICEYIFYPLNEHKTFKTGSFFLL